MKKLLMLVAAAFMFSSAQAQLDPYQPIPADKEVRMGRLENGMTYYIRHNQKPKGQASFYILHDVGAIQEADNQQGLAHFLEHMAFNGTKNMEGKEMISYLEKIGVKFGANLNAGTAWDYTQYEINDVPTSRQGIIDTALLILHDWSHFIALQPEEIDAERGVISEELRMRDGAQFRAMQKMIGALAKGTLYEHRNVIGHLDGLKSFSYDDIRDFYNNWYRPEYQAIAIVGDIDVDKVEADLIKLMSDIPATAAGAPQKEVIVVPDNEQPIISIYTDPEMTHTEANIFIKRAAMPKEANSLVVRELQDIILLYANEMLNARLSDITMQPNAPFLSADSGNGSVGVIPTMDATMFSVRTEDGKLASGFEALLTEIEKARRFGFTGGEYERAQSSLMRHAESSYNNRNDRNNKEYVDRLLANFKQGMSFPDATTEWQLDSMLLQLIPVEAVNQTMQQLITPNNWVITANAPEKEGLVNPTEAELQALIEKVRGAEIAAHEDNTVKEPLIANMKALKGSPVKTTGHNDVFGTTEWTLKNGAKIIVKPTTYKADEVRLNVEAKGGRSIVSDNEYYTAQFMPGIMGTSGLGKFSAVDLRKQLSGKTANIGLSIDTHTHGMNGNSSPKDIETMLQMLYLNFTAPRFNEGDYNTYMTQFRSQIENLLKNPDYIVQDQLMKTVYNNNLRAQVPSVEILDGIRFEELKSIHEKLYNGANNFTFTFVGNVDLATLKPLVEKYIGSLPASKTTLNYVDDKIDPVKGQVVNDFRTPMLQPKVSVWHYFSGDVPYTIKDRMKMNFLTQILRARYLQSIREERGGSYSIGVDGNSGYAPKQTYYMYVQFDTNEELADELCGVVIEELKTIAEKGPQTEDVEKVREFLTKDYQNGLAENGVWMDYIKRNYTTDQDYITNYMDTLKGFTNEDIQQFAQKILSDNNTVRIVMRPEAAKAE